VSNTQALIGLVAQHSSDQPDRYFLNAAYVNAIHNAGGIPIIIPYQPLEGIRTVLHQVRGVVLTGGVDVDPQRYGEAPHRACGEINPLRDELDLAVTELALERNLPILAICRGAQVLNVALGGTLVQDIPEQIPGAIKHRQEAPKWYGTHSVSIQPGSLLSSIVGSDAQVNSYHHQAIAKVGTGLRVSAEAPDGVVEAVESTPGSFVLGVQWHPELMEERCPAARALFRHFVQAVLAN
jgi:putative glutamine amidotransferase